MLMGVCTVSSASIKDGWLSPDACREGASTATSLARDRGREKLKCGLDKRLPFAEKSEHIDGDLGIGCTNGELGDERALLVESFL